MNVEKEQHFTLALVQHQPLLLFSALDIFSARWFQMLARAENKEIKYQPRADFKMKNVQEIPARFWTEQEDTLQNFFNLF